METKTKLSEIGLRYLKRTHGDMDALHGYVSRLQAGDATALQEMEMLVHKIHGSGAMLGFAALSEVSGEMEKAIGLHRMRVAAGSPQSGGSDYAGLVSRLAMQSAQLAADVQRSLDSHK